MTFASCAKLGPTRPRRHLRKPRILGEKGKADNMTKVELIEEISRVVEMTHKDSEVIVDAILDSVVRALRGGDRIEIRGFGSFRTRQRQPRVGRNPKTGARVEVPAKRVASFKPSKELKDLVYRLHRKAIRPPGEHPPIV